MPAGVGITAAPGGRWIWPASLISGVLAAHLFHTLPHAAIICVMAVLAGFALASRRLRPFALMILACCWTLTQFHLRLQGRLDPALANQVITLKGVISSIPSKALDSTRFRFLPDPVYRSDGLPATLLVTWYRDSPVLKAGEYWQLELKLKPPWGGVNFQGPDKERWLFAQGIGGLGTVRNGKVLAPPSGYRFAVNRIREQVLQNIAEQVSDERQRGVIQALATADRSGLARSDSALLAATGTSHLLAISGLHVGLAAAGGMWLSRLLLLFLPVSRIGGATLTLSISTGLACAFAYAALAGFGLPTLRSVLMLLTALSAVLLCRSIHPLWAWVASLAVILLIDPFAPLGAGLWFSYLAVGSLLWVFQTRTGPLNWWKTMLMAQAGVILVLTPVSAAWFGSFSPAGFAANLLAIPWVSIVVVPAVLAGLTVLPFSAFLAGLLWTAAGWATSVLFHVLEFIDGLQGQVLSLPPPTLLQTLLGLSGAFLCLLPRGLPLRWLGLFLIVPLFIPPGQQGGDGALSLEVLDAGQGTAALANSGEYVLLYDSGPGDGRQQNLVASVIAPALAGMHTNTPTEVIISHADLDHAGGIQSLLSLYPHADYRANLNGRNDELAPCTSPFTRTRSDITMETLHPSPWLPYLGNDSSCVISLASAGGRVLLSGDISEVIENRLIRAGLTRHKLLLVPHHGSNTSSSQAFIETLRPEVAIATASLGNRFDFPRAEIRKRYESAGVQFWSTGDCGALRVLLGADGSLHADSARRLRNRIWRWPAAANCP